MSTISEKSQAAEKHFTPQEIAELWSLCPRTIRRIFQDEPGVLKIGESFRSKKRGYQTLRIPASVLERVHKRRAK